MPTPIMPGFDFDYEITELSADPDVGEVKTSGYSITQQSIDSVSNAFLDLSEALGETFYFLEGTYSQIVLEKIFNILNEETYASRLETAASVLAEVQKNLADANEKYDTLLPLENIINILGGVLYANLDMYNDSEYDLIKYSSPLAVTNSEGNEVEENINLSAGSAIVNVESLFSNVETSDEHACEAAFKEAKGEITSAVTRFNSPNPLNDANTAYTLLSNKFVAIEKIEEFFDELDKVSASNVNAKIDELKDQISKKSGDAANADECVKLEAGIKYLQGNKNSLRNSLTAYKDLISKKKSDFSKYIELLTNGGIKNALNAASAELTKEVYDADLEKIKDAFTTLSNAESLSSLSFGTDDMSFLRVGGVLGSDSYFENSSFRNFSSNSQSDTTKLKTVATKLGTAKEALQGVSSRLIAARKAFNEAVTKYKNASYVSDESDAFFKVVSSMDALANLIDGEGEFFYSGQKKQGSFKDFEESLTTIPPILGHMDSLRAFEGYYNAIDDMISFCNNNSSILKANDGTKDYYVGGNLKQLTRSDLGNFMEKCKEMFASVKTKIRTAQANVDSIEVQYDKIKKNCPSDINPEELFNLCMLASTPQQSVDGNYSVYRLLTSIKKEVDSETGNYKYVPVYGGKTLNEFQYKASFSKEDGYAHMALPYFALAIMYEKTCVQQMILEVQLKEIEKINEEIQENNNVLKALSWLYDQVYNGATAEYYHEHIRAEVRDAINAEKEMEFSFFTRGIYSSTFEKYTGIDLSDLNSYLKNTVGFGEGMGSTTGDEVYYYKENYGIAYVGSEPRFYFPTAHYDSEGQKINGMKWSDAGNTSNIDVHEQSALTFVSNLQDQVRIYGDGLSADSQMMTTKMQQYMQNANACVSACTQVVKSIGDYYKTIISNIR
jgi:hypothetical protein